MRTLRKEETKVGFIGTGVMGRSMAGHLLRAGYSLHIFNRTKEKAAELLEAGAVWEPSPAAVAARCRVIVTMLGFPKDVEEIYLSEDGVIPHMKAGGYLIDMTTSRPGLAQRIEEEGKKRGLHCLDAPVSGGDIGAREARLSIMVGGDRQAFAEVLPLLEVMGKNIVYQGPAGSGQHTKMANQIAIASGMIGVCEAMAYAKRSGLDPETVLQSIGGGAAGSWSLSNLAPRMIAGDFDPGFYIKHFIKDMGIALEASEGMGLKTPGLGLAETLYQKLARQGGEENGTQALYKLYES